MIRTASTATTSFAPGDPATWIARGRKPEHAAALAQAWRDFPDLPPAFPLEERMARTRERVMAMRPVHDAISADGEAQRQAQNFAFMGAKARAGTISEGDLAILHGRDRHGYGWDDAVRYAGGWYAAHAGWPYSPRPHCHTRHGKEIGRAAYDQGFADGGGDRGDLFDVARRQLLASTRTSNQPVAASPAQPARPLPSSWPLPTDQARPTVEGLWRKTTRARPGRMTDFIRRERLLPAAEVDRIWRDAPADLIRFQDVAAMIPVAERPTMADWLERFHAGLAVTNPAVDLAA